MRRITISFISVFVAGLLLVPSIAWPQAQEGASDAPQVAQALVREGDFAIKLVEALKLGTAEDEAQAENMLVTTGIEPRNGWISDYPVTPDVIGELQNSIISAADSGNLTMPRDDAVHEFQSLCASLGLSVAADTSGVDYGSEPVTGSSQYDTPTVVNNYYFEYGPPVVTYYAPPRDYYYLYSWVPYPFWYGRFFFSGFFCLRNFNKTVLVQNRHKIVTNRVFDRRIHRVVRVDPATRRVGRSIETERISPRSGFTSTEARRGAQSILSSSVERAGVSQAAPSPRKADVPERNLSSSGVDRRLQKATPPRESGRLPDSPRRDFGSPASVNRGESSGRHDRTSPQEVRGGMGSFGNRGSSGDLVGGANTLRSEGSGRDFRSGSGNVGWSNSSRESRGGTRAFGNHGSSREPVGGTSTVRSEASGRNSGSGSGNSAGSSSSTEIRGSGRGSSYHAGGGAATRGGARCVGRC